jgi:hypothetical protein
VITYDRKRKDIMRRTTKKIILMLDNSILITIEEKMLRTSEIIGARMPITDATLDRVK